MAPSPRVWQTEAPSDHRLPPPPQHLRPVGAPGWARPPFSGAVMVWTRNPRATWPRVNGPPPTGVGAPGRRAPEALPGTVPSPPQQPPGAPRPLRLQAGPSLQPLQPHKARCLLLPHTTACASRALTPCRPVRTDQPGAPDGRSCKVLLRPPAAVGSARGALSPAQTSPPPGSPPCSPTPTGPKAWACSGHRPCRPEAGDGTDA